jgi:hypothetical protein
MLRRVVLAGLAVGAAAAFAACATGQAEPDDGVFVPGEDPDATGGGPRDGAPGDDGTGRDGGPRRVADGGSGDDGSATGDGSGGGDAGGDSGGTLDGGTDGGTTGCGPANTCPTSTSMGSVRGDVGADTVTANGSTSQWLYVNVTEADNSIIGSDLYMVATLASPPGVNFDLYIYAGQKSPPLACSPVTRQSTSQGLDAVEYSWGEGIIPNGSDDSRLITIEVRHVSGTCDPQKKWTLNVYGYATL